MSNSVPDSTKPHRPRPLPLALFTLADARSQAVRDYHQRCQAALAEFHADRQALSNRAWEEVCGLHERAVAESKSEEAGQALQAFVEAQHAYQTGAAVKGELDDLLAAYAQRLADIAAALRAQLEADQRSFVVEVEAAASASLKPGEMDAESIAWLQLALQAIYLGSPPAHPTVKVPAEVPETPAPASKPARAAKASESDHG